MWRNVYNMVALVISCSAAQIFGGAGYNQELPVEKLMRDAKIFQVYYVLHELYCTCSSDEE